MRDDPQSWKGTLGNDTNSWKWATTGHTNISDYQNWSNGEPNNSIGSEECVLMLADGQWYDTDCQSLLPFVCYTGESGFGFTNSTCQADRLPAHRV